MENVITIFTDGSSRGNPGPGGWGAVIVLGDNNGNVQIPMTNVQEVQEIGGREENTTNNRMELTAVIRALQQFPISNFKFPIKIYTDSKYVVNGITKWVYSWEKRNWITANKEPVLNKDLWEDLMEAVSGKNIDWIVVSGHVGISGNERADQIATAFADGFPPELFEGKLEDYKIKNILDISFDASAKKEKSEKKKRSNAKAYSYVSLVDGKVETHQNWADCERRVKGKNAKFKKVFSAEEEKALIKEWSK